MARDNMLHNLKVCGVVEGPLLKAFERTPREFFVEDQHQDLAFADINLPGENQDMLSPSLIAKLLLAADIGNEEHVLLVGGHDGYLTALIANLARQVVSLGYNEQEQQHIQMQLSELNLNNIHFSSQDSLLSTAPKGAFDCILFTQGLLTLPCDFMKNIKPGGCIVAVIGDSLPMIAQKIRVSADNKPHIENLFETSLPYFPEIKRPRTFKF